MVGRYQSDINSLINNDSHIWASARKSSGTNARLRTNFLDNWVENYRGLEQTTPELFQSDVKATGRTGLAAESVLRCVVLKQYSQISYEAVAFYLEDSQPFRSFARLPFGLTPRKSVLQRGMCARRTRDSR